MRKVNTKGPEQSSDPVESDLVKIVKQYEAKVAELKELASFDLAESNRVESLRQVLIEAETNFRAACRTAEQVQKTNNKYRRIKEVELQVLKELLEPMFRSPVNRMPTWDEGVKGQIAPPKYRSATEASILSRDV